MKYSIRRFSQRKFSISDFFSKLFKVKENTSRNEADIEKEKDPDIMRITFKELDKKDPWPAIVTMGLKEFDGISKMKEFEGLLKKIKLIGNNDYITNVYVLSDNVKGKSGLTVMCIEFSKGTKIDSGVRLCYGDRIKWPEDFISQYSGWYKSGKDI